MADSPTPRRFLPWLLVLFAGSGCSALIYEIVWLQLLQLSLGSTAISLAVLLGSFMGGMCLGSLALPRVVPLHCHPMRVYAVLELGIGLLGIALLFGLPHANRLYAAVSLLPATLLMGASLPAVARWVETTPRGVSWLGFFYGGNIAGAVFGCLAAGFYLLRVHDMATATYAAAAINAAVAGLSFGLAAMMPYRPPAGDAARDGATRAPGSWPVYVAIALSGLCALGAEVIWTRLLSLMLGATVYTFSIILAVFLAGLGIGGGVGAWLARGAVRPRMALGGCQLLLTAAIAWAAHMLARSLPYWSIQPPRSSPWLGFGFDFLRCLCAVLPAACLWGASFPLALAGVARRGQDPGRLLGRVYAANTAGAIVGAVAFSLLLIPGIGTGPSQRVLIGLSALAALASISGTGYEIPKFLFGDFVACPRIRVLAGAVMAAGLAWSVPAVPWGLVAYGRQLPARKTPGELLYLGEGMNASIVISESDGTRVFHVSGKVEASSGPQDMRVQRMLGHLPALLHPKPRSVLVVGCGAGVTAGSFVVHPEVERIVICEIESLIPPASARYFGTENHDVLRDGRTEVVYDDARHYILTTRDRFDVITSDPIHPWVKGSATLYTKEYFELCKRHLNPNGIVTQWVPLYESTADTVKSEIATFFDVFPKGTIWGNDTVFGEGYDVVLLGQAGALKIDVNELERRLDRAGYSFAVKSLKEVGFGSAISLLSTYAGQGPDFAQWLGNAQINRDRNLRLQYLAGMGLNARRADFIYEDILRRRKYPEDLFVASPLREQDLRKALARR